MDQLKGRSEPRIFTKPRRRITRKTTLGFDVIEWAEKSIGWKALPWQRWLLIHALEVNDDGSPVFGKVGVMVARQNGKSELLAVLILYWLTHGTSLILSSSASLDTARESWLKACDWAQDHPDVFGTPKIRSTNGLWALELPRFRSRYKIVSANRRGGRGLTADRLVVDELREHRDWDAVGAAESTTLAVPDAQIWYLSNAGDAGSVVLNHYRGLALSGDDDTLFWAEWSAPDGCDLDDRAAWAQANPSLGYTLTERALEARLGQPPAVFRTENLCQSVPSLNEAINPDAWESCTDPASMDRHRDRVVACVDVSPDLRHITLVVAAPMSDGRIRVEVAGAWGSTSEARAELPELVARINPRKVGYFPTGPAAAMRTDLKALPRSVELTGAEIPTACQALAEQVTAGRVAHPGDPLLTSHVLGASKLRVGDGWKFKRIEGHCDAAYALAGSVYLARSTRARPELKVITGSNPQKPM